MKTTTPTIAAVQQAMKGNAWWLEPGSEAARTIGAAVSAGYLRRFSHTQIEWTEAGVAKAHRDAFWTFYRASRREYLGIIRRARAERILSPGGSVSRGIYTEAILLAVQSLAALRRHARELSAGLA